MSEIKYKLKNKFVDISKFLRCYVISEVKMFLFNVNEMKLIFFL